MVYSIVAILSGLAAIAQAYTTPTTQIAGDGNSIFTPGLQQAVPAGQPFNVTWKPTTQGTVTIVLMRGPGEDIKPLYPIVEKTANTGSFVWTPKTDLEPDVTHYGLQLIDDATGQYQWSTQFGISNPNRSSGSASASASGSATTPNGSVASASSTAFPSTTPPKNGTSSATLTSHVTSVQVPTTAVTRTLSTTKSSGTPLATPTGNMAAVQKVGGVVGLVGGVLAMLAL